MNTLFVASASVCSPSVCACSVHKHVCEWFVLLCLLCHAAVGMVPMLLMGRWGTPMPHPCPMTVVFGKPIEVPHVEEPADEQVGHWVFCFSFLLFKLRPLQGHVEVVESMCSSPACNTKETPCCFLRTVLLTVMCCAVMCCAVVCVVQLYCRCSSTWTSSSLT